MGLTHRRLRVREETSRTTPTATLLRRPPQRRHFLLSAPPLLPQQLEPAQALRLRPLHPTRPLRQLTTTHMSRVSRNDNKICRVGTRWPVRNLSGVEVREAKAVERMVMPSGKRRKRWTRREGLFGMPTEEQIFAGASRETMTATTTTLEKRRENLSATATRTVLLLHCPQAASSRAVQPRPPTRTDRLSLPEPPLLSVLHLRSRLPTVRVAPSLRLRIDLVGVERLQLFRAGWRVLPLRSGLTPEVTRTRIRLLHQVTPPCHLMDILLTQAMALLHLRHICASHRLRLRRHHRRLEPHREMGGSRKVLSLSQACRKLLCRLPALEEEPEFRIRRLHTHTPTILR